MSLGGPRERQPVSWWFVEELNLSVECPGWCARHDATGDVDVDADLAADGPVALCLFHAAQAVEDGDVDPADLTVAPAPNQRENAAGAR